MLERMVRLLVWPFWVVYARLRPVAYAKHLGVHINGRVTIYGSSYEMFSTEPYLVTLHDNVFVSVGAKFICHDGGVLPFRKNHPTLDLAAPIVVKSNTFIGAGALILKGVTIGENCIVGANAVVSKDVAPGTIVAGNPARFVKNTEDYIQSALKNSLGIGHLEGLAKDREYRRIFQIK
ncbi:acyltransferase [Novosphingobium sp.]|uniref:acyltransferase n=1 Tax=Novosphingobium sp. TaxID=1874826 RepID=UPI0022BAD39A|nr:acyltransferase [Novosphingobium sp.]MCZ8075267.1 acyltransferase [Roseateles sp.]MCZ8085649.1 acyltransferase [Paracoccaceae bacterium]MCZ8255807.1 acyltransferase [Polaromonas sp.]MCZ8036416.1 acyltransferase [Novosphingobium sp.]MCZ8233485.1 acyltransferase [Novosphingobium sp.]